MTRGGSGPPRPAAPLRTPTRRATQLIYGEGAGAAADEGLLLRGPQPRPEPSDWRSWPTRAQLGVAGVGAIALVVGAGLAFARLRDRGDATPPPSARRYLFAAVGFVGLLQYGVQWLELVPRKHVQTYDQLDRLAAHPEWCRGHPEPAD